MNSQQYLDKLALDGIIRYDDKRKKYYFLHDIYEEEIISRIINCEFLNFDNTPKTFFGLGEMTLMWILMAIAHSSNACYCDIKSLLKKKQK